LRRNVLEHDPAIAAAAPAPPLAAAVGRRPRRHVPARLIAGVGALLVVVAAGAALIRGSGDPPPALRAAGDSLVRIDPVGNRVAAVVPVGRTPISVSLGRSSVWTVNLDDQTVSRVDDAGQRLTTFSTGPTPTAI